MIPRTVLLSAGLLGAAVPAHALDLGNLVFVGDSITQGGNSGSGGATGSGGYAATSYRYDLWKALVDNGTAFTFVGSQTGAYQSIAVNTPGYKSSAFSNVHEGHFGWRASWENGSVALPSGRYDTNNLGRGTIANWTTGSGTFATADQGTLTYNNGSTKPGYTPDTVVVMIGINDIADGISAATAQSRIQSIVQQYQTANPNARIFVASTLNVSANHSLAATMNPKVDTLNAALATAAAGWSTGSSTVSFADVRTGFDATKMTYDNTHPSYAGERIVAANLSAAMGVGARDNTIGLATRAGTALATTSNFSTLPGTTAGTPLFRAGTTGNWTTGPGAGQLTLNATGSAGWLQSNWALASGASFSLEVRLQMTANATPATNNFIVWTDDGTAGATPGFLRIFTDRTEWGFSTGVTRLSLDFNDNTSALHTFRLVYNGSTYAVWRDGALIGDGLAGDSGIAQSASTNRIILGNSSSSETASATLDYANFETGTAYATVAAVPEPGTYGLIGAGALAAAALVRRRRTTKVA